MTTNRPFQFDARELVRDVTVLGSLACIGGGCWALWGLATAAVVVGTVTLVIVIGGAVIEAIKS